MHAQNYRSYLSSLTQSGSIHELVSAPRSRLEAAGVETPEFRERALIIEKVASGKTLNPAESYKLEAIIIPDKRPAIDVFKSTYTVHHVDWLHLDQGPARQVLEPLFRSIGRIELPRHPKYPYGGTGFVVGKDLLMTNRHVAEIFAEGIGEEIRLRTGVEAGIDFIKERDATATQYLQVRRVRMIHPYWDMALLQVQGLDANHPSLSLSPRSPEDLSKREVAVIGYPAFDPRNNAFVQNEVFGGKYGIKRLQPGYVTGRRITNSFEHPVNALAHDASTLGGNSGSCIIDTKTGEVLGLHFGGLYLDANYGVPSFELARDSRVVDAGVKFAGAAPGGPNEWGSYWINEIYSTAATGAATATATSAPAVNASAANDTGSTGANVSPSSAPAVFMNANGGISMLIPLEISARLLLPGAVASAIAAPQAFAAVTPTVSAQEATVQPHHEANYDGRPGYDPDFLGITVPLPKPVSTKNIFKLPGGNYEIPYYHFSVVMNRKRRLAVFTAANVSADPALKKPGNRPDADYTRAGLSGLGKNDIEQWFSDPRLPPDTQLPDRFYTKDRKAFDKGHIVRREDVAWGRTYKELRAANGDTYHVTNCSPQVLGFNRSGSGEDNWGDLENFVLRAAKQEKISVFAGPVLGEEDPVFVGLDDDSSVSIPVPVKFWKLLVVESEGHLQAFAFVLEQSLADVNMELVISENWLPLMVPVSEIEELAQVRFSKAVRMADQFSTTEGIFVRRASGVGSRAAGEEAAAPQYAIEAPVVAPPELEEMLSLWKEQQATDAAGGNELRFVINLREARNDEWIQREVGRVTRLKVEVESLFPPALDLAAYRLLRIPAIATEDRADLFDMARLIRNVCGADTVDPDLGTHYYDWDGAARDGSVESVTSYFSCFHGEDRANVSDPDWANNKTRVPEAWQFSQSHSRPSHGKGVDIFHLDTGLVPTHAELPADLVKHARAKNFVEPGRAPEDVLSKGSPGHGTGTASVAGSPSSGKVNGSAPAATIIPVRCIKLVAVFNQSTVAQAIAYAAHSGAHVVTMSLGGVFSAALHAAVREAVEAHVIVVAAAGNCVKLVVWPARYEEVIGVGGINEGFLPWQGSCRGEAVDISGPAEFVQRADARDPAKNDAIGLGEGTSFATANLAGIAALWLAHHGRENLINSLPPGVYLQDLFRAVLQRTAHVPPGFDRDNYGAGIVDALALLKADPAMSGMHEAAPFRPRDARSQVRDLLEEVAGTAGLEAAEHSLVDPQNAAELACLAFDRAQLGTTARARTEALPPLNVSTGLKKALGPKNLASLAVGVKPL